MSNPRNGIAGFRLTEHTWMTELGNWIDAISPDGRRAGALLFDSTVIGLPGVRDRVVSAVLTDRNLALSGVQGLIPVADVVAAGQQVWLLTAQAVTPTLSTLLASGSVDPNGAAAVLADTAQTLLALHAYGVTHGSVQPGTVVITAEGTALLSERGLADAIRGQVSGSERDVAGWAALARGLAASCGRVAPQAAALFERAAGTAITQGLAAARSVLLAEPEALPGGVITRDRLAQAARGQSVFAQPAGHLRQDAGSWPDDRDEGEIVTLLHVPGSGTAAGSTGHGGESTTPGDPRHAVEEPTHVSPRNRQGNGREAVRFGPGVGAQAATGTPETGAERIWREGREEAATAQGARARAQRARRRRTVLSTVLFAVIMAGAVVAWLRLSADTPELAVRSVAVAGPKKAQGCDSVVLLTGTIVTNGAPGEIAYEWRKNLDKEVTKATLRATSGKTSYTLPLRWSLQGRSTVKATATLRVLSPGPARTGRASFTYRC